MAVLCHDDTLALEFAVILYLQSVGYTIDSVSCYNPYCKIETIQRHLRSYTDDTDLLSRVHVFNRSNMEEFYSQVHTGLHLVWGLNCSIPIPLVQSGKLYSFIQICDLYRYFLSLSYPNARVIEYPELWERKAIPTPSYSFVCDPIGYYGEMRRVTTLLSITSVNRLVEQFAVIKKLNMQSRIRNIPVQRPEHLTDTDLVSFFTNPYLNLQTLERASEIFRHNKQSTWLPKWYVQNIYEKR